MGKNKANFLLCLLIGVFLLSGCANKEDSTTATRIESVPTPTVTEKTESPPIINTVLPTPTITATSTSVDQGCPTRSEDGIYRLKSGSIFFSYLGETSQSILSISPNTEHPQMVYEPPQRYQPMYDTRLSPDGTLLAWDVARPEQGELLVIYDFQEQRVLEYELEEPWKFIDEWTRDGKLSLFVDEVILAETGIKFTNLIFDPVTQAVEEKSETVKMPGLYIEGPLTNPGFYSFDSTGKYVLYTGMDDSGDVIFLRDLTNDKNLWKYTLTGSVSPLPYPDWSMDGSQVALSWPTKGSGEDYKIY